MNLEHIIFYKAVCILLARCQNACVLEATRRLAGKATPKSKRCGISRFPRAFFLLNACGSSVLPHGVVIVAWSGVA